MSLLDDVITRAVEIRSIVERHRASNPRVFGSVARRQDSRDSDIDFLVDAGADCSLLDIGGLTADLEDLFGRRVDVRTINDLHSKMRQAVLAEAITL